MYYVYIFQSQKDKTYYIGITKNLKFIMYYVYIFQSQKDKTYYIGITKNLKKRIKKHNLGKIKYTSHRKPYKLLSHCVFLNKETFLKKRFV